MATQRPSVDVITGTIKANFPTRISFQVSSKFDSRTILGSEGAEKLLGKGDMLLMTAGGKTTRIHESLLFSHPLSLIAYHPCQVVFQLLHFLRLFDYQILS